MLSLQRRTMARDSDLYRSKSPSCPTIWPVCRAPFARVYNLIVGDSSKRDLNGRPSDLVRTNHRGLVRWNCARRTSVTVGTAIFGQQLVERWPNGRAYNHSESE